MGFIDSIYDKARINKQRIAIPECTNEVMMRAAVRAAEAGIADIVFVGDRNEINTAAEQYGIVLSSISIAEMNDETYKKQLIERYSNLPNKIMGTKSVSRRMNEPLYFSMVMEAVGDVGCTLAGLEATTYEVVLAASSIIGLADGTVTPSAFFVVELEDFDGEQGSCIGMSDGGITLEPNSAQLASIAISCCKSFTALMDRDARCAMLSYSTCGSGSGPSVDRVRDAVEIAKTQRPDLMIDGEFQADAALSLRVGAKKVKRDSEVAGKANVLVFPDIASCNIGSKLVQLLAKCNTYGPLLQGFRLPVCDCSRGDTEQRIFDNIAASGVLAAYNSEDRNE